ncbi:MAG: glycosyltransferase family 39 protein [Planctomycetaceae bacterium]|nr:glycosyltransferase family 39 protein [Planctomycetaceae bacterium]
MRMNYALTALLILGIVIRLSAGWVRPSDLILDSDGYLAHAEMVKNGQGFAGPSTHRPTAFRPPGYPIALAGLRWLGMSPLVSVLLIHQLCGIALILCVWKLCQQLALTRGASLLATALTVFDPLLIRYSILPMTEVPAAAMLIAAIVALKAAEQAQNNSVRTAYGVRPEIGFRILAGVLFGLGSLVRPVLLVSCCLLVFWRLVLTWKTSSPARNSVAVTILPMIAAVVAISPWIVRNALQFGKIIPATTHGGYTLALGNNPDFYGDVIEGRTGFPWPGPQLDAWQRRMIAEAAAQGIPANSETAQDAWYYQQAIASIKAAPTNFLRACCLRLWRFCAISPGTDDGLPRFLRTSIASWYGLIGIGIVATIWNRVSGNLRRPRHNALSGSLADIWLVILSFMILHAVYWTDARMRAPVMPLMAIVAVVGWQSIFNTGFSRIVGRSCRGTNRESSGSSELEP